MKLKVALAGACVLALTAGAASAAVSSHNRAMRHHTVSRRASASGRFGEPSQPIAYSKLAAYEKASPRARATQNWGLEGAGMAAGATTGAAANASATAPQPGTTAPNEMGASAPAPSAAAPNPPAPAAEPTGAPPATPDTSAAPPASAPPAKSPQ